MSVEWGVVVITSGNSTIYHILNVIEHRFLCFDKGHDTFYFLSLRNVP